MLSRREFLNYAAVLPIVTRVPLDNPTYKFSESDLEKMLVLTFGRVVLITGNKSRQISTKFVVAVNAMFRRNRSDNRKVTDMICETKPSQEIIDTINDKLKYEVRFHVVPNLRKMYEKYNKSLIVGDAHFALAIDMRDVKHSHQIDSDRVMLLAY